jgi:hypothetical protein
MVGNNEKITMMMTKIIRKWKKKKEQWQAITIRTPQPLGTNVGYKNEYNITTSTSATRESQIQWWWHKNKQPEKHNYRKKLQASTLDINMPPRSNP